MTGHGLFCHGFDPGQLSRSAGQNALVGGGFSDLRQQLRGFFFQQGQRDFHSFFLFGCLPGIRVRGFGDRRKAVHLCVVIGPQGHKRRLENI